MVPQFIKHSRILNNFLSAAKFAWPYFKPSYSNLSKPLVLLCSFLLPFIDVILLKSLVPDNEKEADTNNHNTTFALITPIILSTIIYSAKFASNKYLVESVKKSIKIDNVQKLLDNKTKFLISVESSNIESLQEVTIGRRVDNFVETLIPLCVGTPLCTISILSALTRINIITKSSTAVIYALGLSSISAAIVCLVGKSIAHYNKEEEAINSTLLARSSFIEGNKDSIILMEAANFERESIIHVLKVREKETLKFSQLLFINFFISTIAGQLLSIFLPKDVTKVLSLNSITYLNLTTGILINETINLSYIYTQVCSNSEDNLRRLEKFNNCYKKYTTLYSKNNTVVQEFNNDNICIKDKRQLVKQEYIGKALFFKNFSVHLSDNALLDNTTISLDVNKIYRLSGQSGCGKTTILKAIIGCWPYTDGMIVYPTKKDDICFIPQKVCIPPKFTLLEIIAYPSKVQDLVFKYRLEYKQSLLYKVKVLLKNVDLLPGSIEEEELESEGINWDARLSGGEKQKLAIIRAIIKKPILLIMDEPTVALDKVNKENIYKIIKNEVIIDNIQDKKNSIIIYTDHNPIEGFADYVLTIDDQHQLQLIGEGIEIP